MRAAIGLMIFLVAVSLEAQAPPSFREGVIAFEKKDWAAAETAMRAAIAGNPKETEGTVSISGSWFETYVPHYFLARALAKQGKCQEALVEFAESERQGVTPAIGDFARHLETRDGCRKGAKGETKPPREIGVVEVPFGSEAPPPKSNPVEPKPPVPEPKPPVAGPKPSTTTPGPKPAPISRETRNRLSAAVTAYLAGRYADATRILDGSAFAEPAAAAEAALFRAAARDALYRIGGMTDNALAREIESDLRAYRRLRPDGRPDPRVFPPHFIALAGVQ